jgi:hypothetical protein
MTCGMLNRCTPLAHHFLDLTLAEPTCHIPVHAPQDEIALKMVLFERYRHHPSHSNNGQIISDSSQLENLLRNPILTPQM